MCCVNIILSSDSDLPNELTGHNVTNNYTNVNMLHARTNLMQHTSNIKALEVID